MVANVLSSKNIGNLIDRSFMVMIGRLLDLE